MGVRELLASRSKTEICVNLRNLWLKASCLFVVKGVTTEHARGACAFRIVR